MLARVLYRDGLMLVIDKPAGLPCIAGRRAARTWRITSTRCASACRAAGAGAPARPRHLRLPGAGAPPQGAGALGLLFKHGKIDKTYWAVVEGGPATDEGRIDIPLGRLDETRGWWMKPDPHGAPAVTTWKVLGRGAGKTWLALEPLTGRTHQLRVHCAAMGLPIVGDNIYGRAPRFGGPPLHLHSREIVVPISKNKPPVKVTAPVPPHMRDALTTCGWRGESQ